jgi:hypothetical protein
MNNSIKTLLVFSIFSSLSSLSMALPESEMAPPSPAATTVEAPGQFFYKMPSGEIVRRDTILVVPMKGQGEVSFKTATKNVKAKQFWTEHNAGRTIFYVAIENPPGAPENTSMILEGSYIRGTNLALYYGDVYQKTGTEQRPSDLVPEKFRNSKQIHYFRKLTGYKYAGGFVFKAEVK